MKKYWTQKSKIGDIFMFMAMALFLSYCGKGDKGGLSSAQLDAIGEAFAFTALSAGGGAISPSAVSSLNELGLASSANCSPDQLTPPYNCPGGGNIYYTINLNCAGPSGCCAQQNPCSKDSMSISGMGSTLYNSCTVSSSAGDHVVINGTITTTITSTAEITCPSIITVNVKVTMTGMRSITVNGREVCKGDVFLTATAYYGRSIYTTISGTVCGYDIYQTYNYGCTVKCSNGSCCPTGSYCGTCTPDSCFSVAYPVDCCNGYACPGGTQCVQVGGDTKCQWTTSLNEFFAIPGLKVE
jgi:hypothetical protein